MKLFTILVILFSFQIANAWPKITLTTKNSCVLSGPVTRKSMKKLKACVANKVVQRKAKKYPIYIYIQSPGGEIYAGMRTVNFLKMFKNVHTITEFSASMAAAIAQGNPGKRYVLPHGIFMFHRARGTFSGQFADGELESQLKMWTQIVRNMELMQSKRIGITLKDYQDKRQNEWWVYGSDNVTQNTADAVAFVTCSKELLETLIEKKYQSFFGTYTVKESACPVVN